MTLNSNLPPLLAESVFGAHQEQLVAHAHDLSMLTHARGLIESFQSQDFLNVDLFSFQQRNNLYECGVQALSKKRVGILFLNGGMATRFGGVPKGVSIVYRNKSFIQLKFEQIRRLQTQFKIQIPILLMNSFATYVPTQMHLLEHGHFGLEDAQICMFNQYSSKRLTPSGNLYLGSDGQPSYYSTGHGDLPQALLNHQVYDFIKRYKIDTLMVSNIDNMGALLSPFYVGVHLFSKQPVSVEIVTKRSQDIGGGPVILNGKKVLLEGFRMPQETQLKSLFGFNTNTFYLSVDSLLRHAYDLKFYPVLKILGEHQQIVQFERILGEITSLEPSCFMLVPRDFSRSRFVPIKNQQDVAAYQDQIAYLYDL